MTNAFVNMAHNDYLQTLMEFGVLGVFLIVFSVVWWIAATVNVWGRSDLDDPRLRRAASIALGVLLMHSFVDYPGRTAAIACLAMACAVLMTAPGSALAKGQRRSDKTDSAALSADHLDL